MSIFSIIIVTISILVSILLIILFNLIKINHEQDRILYNKVKQFQITKRLKNKPLSQWNQKDKAEWRECNYGDIDGKDN
jgi:hypothetical protein